MIYNDSNNHEEDNITVAKTNTKPSKNSIDNEKKKENKYCNANFSSQPTNPGYIFFLPTHLARVLIYYEWHFDKAKSMNENFFFEFYCRKPNKEYLAQRH